MQSSSFSIFKKSFLVFYLSFLSYSITFAEETKNVKISGDDDYLNITWDNISNIDNTDGYALQWNTRQNYVKIDRAANLYRLGKVPGKSLRRASFANNAYYYLRVYSYTEENGKKILGNGSKLIKWKIDNRNQVTLEEIAITDPVLSSSSNSDTSSALEALQNFSNIRILALDNFANFSWAKPRKLAKSDYDGYILTISEKSDLTDPVIDALVDSSQTSVQIKGLKPETKYYVAGYFYKRQGGDNKKFGKGTVRDFKTIALVDRSKYTRASRNIKKLEKKAIKKIEIEGYNNSSTSNSTSSNTESNTTTETTTLGTSSNSVDLSNNKSIENRISAIDAQIRKLRAEKARLELKLGKKPSSVRSQNTSSKKLSLRERLAAKRSSGGLSLRERLRAKLAAKRAAK